MKKTLIAPSMLSADFGNLQRDIELVNESEADWFHLDIMDGVFVPNISFGMPLIKIMRKHARKPLDTHLMILNPDRYIDTFADLGCDILTVHIEACTHLHRTIEAIKSGGMKAGVSLNPHTPIEQLTDILSELDLVLIMSVNPGFGGQKFIEQSYEKIERLVALRERVNSKALIEVDGGVTTTNIQKLVGCGADVLVAGSYIFDSDNPSMRIKGLKAMGI